MAWHLPSISTLVPWFCHTKHWTRAAIHIPSEKLRCELTRLTRITEKHIFFAAFASLQSIFWFTTCTSACGMFHTGTWYFLAFSSFMVEHYKEHRHQDKKSARVCVHFSKWTCVKTSDNPILLSSLGLLLCWWTCKRKHVSMLTDCRCSSVTLARRYRSWLLRLISLLRETKRDRESETAEAPYTLSGTEPWSVSLETPVFTQLFPAKMAVVNGRQCSCVQ